MAELILIRERGVVVALKPPEGADEIMRSALADIARATAGQAALLAKLLEAVAAGCPQATGTMIRFTSRCHEAAMDCVKEAEQWESKA